MKSTLLKTLLIICTLGFISACSPDVGSEDWCEDLKEKDKGEWTANEAGSYAKHCIM